MSTVAERLAALRAQVEDRRVRAVGVHDDVGYTTTLRHCAAETLTRVRLEVAVLTHIEDVLGRHKRFGPADDTEPPWCLGDHRNFLGTVWPCPDAAAALHLLSTLDGGTDA